MKTPIPVEKPIVGKTYYAKGEKDGMNVSVTVLIEEVSEQTNNVFAKTQRNDIEEKYNRSFWLPLETVKFYPLKNREDYKMIDKINNL